MFPKDKWKLGSLNYFSDFPDLEDLIQPRLSIEAIIPSNFGLLFHMYVCVFNNSFSGI